MTTDLLAALRKAVAAGKPADFDHEEWSAHSKDGSIPGEVVRDLVLGDSAPAGVQILNAHIQGKIDLRNARGQGGGAANTLKLQGCHLEVDDPGSHPSIDACHSHLSRLSLIGCFATGIHLSSAIIEGDLILQGLKPLDDDGTCWVRARGIRVGGSINASGARLSLPATYPTCWSDDSSPYALDLSQGRIGGTLDLRGGFVAYGGLSIAGVTIGADLRANGAHLTSVARRNQRQRHFALNGQLARVDGAIVLRCEPETGDRFHTEGSVQFMYAQVAGGLYMSGAVLGPDIEGQGAQSRDAPTRGQVVWPSLALAGAALGGGLFLDSDAYENSDDAQAPDVSVPFRASNPIELSDASIRGSTEIQGDCVVLANDARFGTSLGLRGTFSRVDLSTASVATNLLLAGTVTGPVELVRATIQGALELDLVLANVNASYPSLDLEDAVVGAGFKVRKIRTAPPSVAVGMPIRIRSTLLRTYEGWRLCEALLPAQDESNLAVLAFLYHPVDGGFEVLNGNTDPIDALNERHPPKLDTADDIREYLSLFCSYVWGDQGSIRFVKPDSQDSGQAINVEAGSGPDRSWTAGSWIEYGWMIFEAKFRVEASGKVTLIESRPVREAAVDGRIRYQSPLRWIAVASGSDVWPVEPLLGAPEAWVDDVDPRRRDMQRFIADVSLSSPDDRSGKAWRRPIINLGGLKVSSLNDINGRAWLTEVSTGPQPIIILKNFAYDRIDPLGSAPDFGELRRSDAGDVAGSSRLKVGRRDPIAWLRTQFKDTGAWDQDDAFEGRRAWLAIQYKDPKAVTPEEYEPQPYEQLAKVWRTEGRYSEATKATFDRLDLERKVYDGPIFEDGLGPIGAGRFRALLVLAFIAFGLLLIPVARGIIPGDVWGSIFVVGFVGAGLLMLSTRVLKWLFLQVPFGYGLKTSRALVTLVCLWVIGGFLVLAGTNAISGDVLKVDASSVGTVYSGSEVVIPTQTATAPETEIRCGTEVDPMLYALDVMVPLLDLRQEQRCRVSALQDAWFWRLVKVTYAVAGWIVVSGLVLTASGFVRRQIER